MLTGYGEPGLHKLPPAAVQLVGDFICARLDDGQVPRVNSSSRYDPMRILAPRRKYCTYANVWPPASAERHCRPFVRLRGVFHVCSGVIGAIEVDPSIV